MSIMNKKKIALHERVFAAAFVDEYRKAHDTDKKRPRGANLESVCFEAKRIADAVVEVVSGLESRGEL